jgi:hypothetical protein
MIKLHFEKIYSTEGRWEPCSVAVPLKKGELLSIDGVCVYDEMGKAVPTQPKITALHSDGSVKWLFVRFFANIPARRAVDYSLTLKDGKNEFEEITVSENGADTGVLSFKLSTDVNTLFDELCYDGKRFDGNYISAPNLVDEKDNNYAFKIDRWEICESGSVCAILKGYGSHILNEKNIYNAEVEIYCYKNQPRLELCYRIINTTEEKLEIKSLTINHSKLYEYPRRCATGISNYKTRYNISEDGSAVEQVIDANMLLYEANEHNAEVFYGTFFADCTDDESGLCATVYQAQQNFPKAVYADKDGMMISLVPEGVGKIVMQSGMARQQRVLFDFHKPFEDLSVLNDTSIRYQMPNKPMVDPTVFEQSGIYEDIFVDDVNNRLVTLEMYLQGKADEHARCYGMLNWGDSADIGYTNQGRGGGELVWTNNEYDFTHACALMYARTGIRRYLDYMLVSGRHWMDVDICHYSSNPLHLNGQWEHTNGHCKNGKIECSHQWVEGLLDYYHFTGDKAAFDAAIEIGKTDLRLLDTPKFQGEGEINARETGWAMRALVALYKETNNEAWLDKCDWIVSHFEAWEAKYGLWLSPYTDNTEIRVVFMIAVAVGSLMRYYRVRPQEKVKRMILHAVDDLVENARLDNGLFYYKELPSLKRFGNNPIILEALAIAYELTGNKQYLEAGVPTLRYNVAAGAGGRGNKSIVEDTVMTNAPGSKNFAQLMVPVTSYYVACMREGVLNECNCK